MDHLSGANVFDIFSSSAPRSAVFAARTLFLSFSLVCQRSGGRRKASKFGLFETGFGKSKPPNAMNVALHGHLYEINGVAATLQQQVLLAQKTGKNLTVVTCEEENHPHVEGVRNFKPIGVHRLPEYPDQKLFYPPFLEMLRFCYKEKFTHLHSATPGPIGLAALAIAHILKLPIIGTYHASLPQYAGYLTDDAAIEEFMWKYMLWYYDRMDFVYVPSKSTEDELVTKGLPPEKIRIFPIGVDTNRFHPSKRIFNSCSNTWTWIPLNCSMWGACPGKKLPQLARYSNTFLNPFIIFHWWWRETAPIWKEMKKASREPAAAFTGAIMGEALDKLYATCDLFVFPSTTETFGNVVLEAQASRASRHRDGRRRPPGKPDSRKNGYGGSGPRRAALAEAIKTLMKAPENCGTNGTGRPPICRRTLFSERF
jgi:glycosyltransferase involved in cell wall biosynthesis